MDHQHQMKIKELPHYSWSSMLPIGKNWHYCAKNIASIFVMVYARNEKCVLNLKKEIAVAL